jgi:hypothetical protein
MKELTILLLVLCAGVLFFACSGSKKSTFSDKPLVELQTGGCRGYCPIFKLSFKDNGMAEYEGIRFVEKEGKSTFKITPSELIEVRKRVKEINFWKYPERIESKVMDAPSATFTVFEGEKTKSVSGTIDRPKIMLDFEAYLKSLAEKSGLVLKGVDPNAPKEATKSEVILRLKDDVNAGNWLRQFGELKLQLVRRTPPGNTWLVAYDSAEIKEIDVIKMFKDTEGCLEAQSNAAAKDRN